MVLTRKTKESLKTALAMTIAYGIALHMDWDKPYWAGFAVAMVSLATIGQSMNKAALRMLGTFLAILVAFVLIALFAQQRWLFILFLSVWVGFCTYMMGGAKNQYVWHVSGFVCTIVAIDAGPDAVNAFTIATLRAQETALGILVYSLVSIFLWPTSSGAQLGVAVAKLASTQHRLFAFYLDVLHGKTDAGDAQPHRADEVAARSRFDLLLAAAVTDDAEVGELRRQWRRYQRLATELSETLERWRECFEVVQAPDLRGLLPDFAACGAELDTRLAQVERMLTDQAPERRPVAVELRLDRSRLGGLSHFQKAALTVACTHLERLESLTRDLYDCVSGIKGFEQMAIPAATRRAPAATFVLDRDRAAGVVRQMVTVWLAWLALIYIDGLPNGTAIVTMTAPIGMALATMPQLRVAQLFVPATVGVLVGAVPYIFVMPQLSSFVGLGLLIFGVTFALCYLFAAPQQMLGRALGLALFITIAGIDNDQTYSFLSVANTALMFALLFLLLSITAHMPVSSRPEKAFLRLTGRFFRSCEYLTANMGRDSQQPESRLDVRRRAFHAHEISTLPGKLAAWGKFIDPKALPGTSPEQIQALVAALQTLARCMQELLGQRDRPQAQVLVEALSADIRAWRLEVKECLRKLSQEPAAGLREAFRSRLAEIMDHLEKRIMEILDKTPTGQFGERDGENFYRLLGAYQSVSEALVDCAGNAGAIDWTRWQEERFA